MAIFRIYVEKKPAYAEESARLLRAAFPNCALTTDFIVGFPGESEAEFHDSLAFVERCAFSAIHVFPYSRREGTKAAALPGQLSAQGQGRETLLPQRLQGGGGVQDGALAAQVPHALDRLGGGLTEDLTVEVLPLAQSHRHLTGGVAHAQRQGLAVHAQLQPPLSGLLVPQFHHKS